MQHVPAYSPLHFINHQTKGPLKYGTKKPELMLILDYVPSPGGLKERRIKVSICLKHSQPCSKYGKTSDLQNTYETLCPDKQRQTVLSHTLCTHICYRHLKVHGSLDTPDTSYVQAENSLVYGCSGMTQCAAKRGVCSPPNTGSLLNQRTQQLLNHCHRLELGSEGSSGDFFRKNSLLHTNCPPNRACDFHRTRLSSCQSTFIKFDFFFHLSVIEF